MDRPFPVTQTGVLTLMSLAVVLTICLLPATASAQTCARTITADVVAIDQPFFYNRLGTVNPAGMIYALRRDVVPIDPAQGLVPGNVKLRSGKRARPITLRMNVNDCLQITFQNLLSSAPVNADQPATRNASIHAIGLQLVGSIASDGSNVGTNPSSLAAPGQTKVYTLFAEREGTHMLYSTGATTGGEGDGGSLTAGLFGAVNVEPAGAEWYRSQVTESDLGLATTGTTPDGHPIINYNAVYPAGHPRAGLPVLKMTQGNEIVHTDLTAVITGPNAGRFPSNTYRSNPVEPDRNQPYREFTTIYHDEIIAKQAFPEFTDPVLGHTLHSVRDGFAINYGTGGVGAEILANRFNVGPMHECTECKFEEFFLSSWAVGDPAQVVDNPANSTDTSGNLIAGPKATKVEYPDDPSNVYHSYLRDHVKFRVLHGGAKEHHIHHQHAKQWLHTPDKDNSTYLDSQGIGPGATYSLDIAYNGSGNRNHTIGDAIFHCHFYPHFAQGMWALWRTHDVFEKGTQLDANGRPAPGSRALPDGEIAQGTPIPGLVPLPTLAMAPLPGANVSVVNGQAVVSGSGNPGYPFFIPAEAGHRPPHPPLDTVDDGGLPRHIITGGTFTEEHTRLSFDKLLVQVDAKVVPETGTPTEIATMNFHATRNHASYKPDGTAGTFIANGLPAVGGAPLADPCVDDNGNPVGTARLYKAASFQFDMKINKAGWHFPQARILSLWEDVQPTQNGLRPPEPLFFRANTGDCITYYLTNLVPNIYEQDDYQVKTPTDVMGQHIHLVKFDVLASDGAGNGFNYEDGSFSPDEVIERIHAINANGGIQPFGGGARQTLTVQPHPFFNIPGAQTTVQRWYADAVLNNLGQDRTLRTVYTHDHFAPSTQQQAGYYAGLVIEPTGSTWRDPETGAQFGGRSDGGPTSWRADILTANQTDSYREFLMEYADFQPAYRSATELNPVEANTPVNPPAREEAGLPTLVLPAPECPGGVPRPCPEAISADDSGTMTVNYRQEPIPLRIRDPYTNSHAGGDAGDLSKVFRSDVTRLDPRFNTQPSFYPPLTGGVQPGDPFTPLLRVYENDKVQIRILVGAQEEGHNFSVHGVKWLFEPADRDSGYRNSQFMGISEHFEFEIPRLPGNWASDQADFLYKPGSSTDDLWNGIWGLLRAYRNNQPDLLRLPNNLNGSPISNPASFNGVCPTNAPAQNFDVTAVTAQQALPGGTLVYNPRPNMGGQLNDPTAILFVRTSDLDSYGKLKANVPIEPLILRARAGDCINVTLRNNLPQNPPDLAGYNTLPMIVENFNANQVSLSNRVGLHPQMVLTDVTRGDGAEVGFNPSQTASPGNQVSYQWYAGDVVVYPNGYAVARPIEFGAINLSSSDPIKHSNKGAIGALIIEPRFSSWLEDANSRASATVTTPGGAQFREFVLLFQNDINMRFGDGSPVPNLAEAEDAEDSGQKALNYRTEPMWKRMGYAPDTLLATTGTFDFTNVLSNSQVGGDPVTPVFTAKAGNQVRFRILHPGGHQRNNVFQVHGHIWQMEPYIAGSTVIGSNLYSEYKGSQIGHGPSNHFDAVFRNGAGGKFRIPGDYLYRDMVSFHFDGGLWGIFRVTP